MKLHTRTLILAFSAGSLAATHAQQVIRIVASNGDRPATQTAISKILGQPTAGNPAAGTGWTFNGVTSTGSFFTDSNQAGYTNTNAVASNFGSWKGTFAGNQVIIKVAYSGALAGIQAVAGSVPQRFAPTNGTNDGTVVNPLTTNTFELGTATFGFSTNFQATSPFRDTYQGITYADLVQENVGVSPLGFYASPGFPVDNLTTQLAQQLYRTGSLGLALFTGSFTNDENKRVFAIGRNTDAGQRYSAYGEIGLGTASSVKVYNPTFAASPARGSGAGGIIFGGVVESHKLWPATLEPGAIPQPEGGGGYSSGALIADKLTVTLGVNAYKEQVLADHDDDPSTPDILVFKYPNATAGYYIGYVTPSDASNRILGLNGVVPAANRGVALKLNGVALHNPDGSVDLDAVRNGKYTAWLYNRIIKSPAFNVSTGVPINFANALRDQIKNTDAVQGGGILLSTLKVRRLVDGGAVTPIPTF